MSMIRRVREWVQSFPLIDEFAGAHVDYVSERGQNFGVFPTGTLVLSQDMAGNRREQYNFILQNKAFTAADDLRLENVDFVEEFTTWVNDHARTGIPLDEGLDFESCRCGNGILQSWDEDQQMGIYALPCSITYERMAI